MWIASFKLCLTFVNKFEGEQVTKNEEGLKRQRSMSMIPLGGSLRTPGKAGAAKPRTNRTKSSSAKKQGVSYEDLMKAQRAGDGHRARMPAHCCVRATHASTCRHEHFRLEP